MDAEHFDSDPQIPPYPLESDLPPADRALHDPESITARLEDVENRPYAAVWALETSARCGRFESIDRGIVERAAMSLLERFQRDEERFRVTVVLRALPLASREAIVLAFLATHERPRDGSDDALVALIDCLALANSAAFVDRLLPFCEHESVSVREAAVEAIVATGDARADAMIESFLVELSEEGYPLDDVRLEVLLAGILRERAPAAITRFLIAVLRTDESEWPVASILGGLDGLGIPSRWVAMARQTILGVDESGDEDDDPAARIAFLAPRGDSASAGSTASSLTRDEAAELLVLAECGRLRRCAERLVAASRRALEAAIAARPSAQRPRKLLAIVEAFEHDEGFRKGPQSTQREVVSLFAAIVAWASRSIATDIDDETVISDPARVRALLRVDLPWLDRSRLVALSRHVDRAMLLELEDPEGEWAHRNVLALFALDEPETYLEPALENALDADECHELALAASDLRGDRVLRPLVEWARACEDPLESGEDLLAVLAVLGTQRAAVIARRTIEALFLEPPDEPMSIELFDSVLALGDAELIAATLARFEAGLVDTYTGDMYESSGASCEFDVGVLLDLAGRDDDPREVVERAVARFAERDDDELADPRDDMFDAGFDDEFDADVDDDLGDDLGDDGDPGDASGDGDASLESPTETIRREAPKIGRNDPCPCGSGRKYKKCCGQAG